MNTMFTICAILTLLNLFFWNWIQIWQQTSNTYSSCLTPEHSKFVPPKNTCVWNTVGSHANIFLNVWCLYHKCQHMSVQEPHCCVVQSYHVKICCWAWKTICIWNKILVQGWKLFINSVSPGTEGCTSILVQPSVPGLSGCPPLHSYSALCPTWNRRTV